ncbi:MAG: phosphoglycerate kinase [Desulfurococcales archaeon]|nr:phosphoglycerate kinase [Desulfurococcales archaeon]
MHSLRLPTIDDIDLGNRRTLVRVDFNCPIGEGGSILDDARIKAHIPTIKKLLDNGAGVVLVTHQGRPGGRDFISLHPHRELLSKYLGSEVRFIEDVIGPAAIQAIKSVKQGDVLLLDNVRFVSEEMIESSPEVQSRTHLVRRLSQHFNYFIFDAFATAHRSQPSIVGFPLVLPSVIGELMRRELDALERITESSSPPRVFVLGGAKVHDTIRIIEYLTKRKIADRILTCGLVGLTFHVAKGGRVGRSVKRVLEETGLFSLVPRARRVLLSGAPVDTPYDYRVLKDSNDVVEEPVFSVEGKPLDIGTYTVEMYSELIKEAKIVVMRGPAGYVEDPRFRRGTEELLKAAIESQAFVIIGGGHLAAMIKEARREGMHVSTGGGALLVALSGEPLPAVQALKVSAKKFFGGKQ